MRLEGQRIAVYCRYSTDKQNPRSIEDQLRVCREHVERLGGSLSDELVFTDAGVSGTSLIRPGFQAMHEAVRMRRVDVVVTEDLSRIGRDVGNNDRVFKQFRSWGARLLSVNDSIDSADENAKFFSTIKSAMAEGYIDEIKKRTRRGLQSLHLAGMHTGGRVFGYRSTPAPDGSGRKRLEVDDAQAAIVRRIFTEYVAGNAMRAIAERLNGDGIESPRRGRWTHLTLRAMLRNEIYVGRVVFNRRQWDRDSETGKRRKTERARSEWRCTERQELRIIDVETWEAAQDRARTVEVTYRQGARPKRGYPLSGLLVCGTCGEALTVNGGGRYYACGGRKKGHGCANRESFREQSLRRWILDHIRDTAGAPSLLEELRAKWAASTGDRDRAIRAELAERRAALTRTETQISKLLDLMLEGSATPSVQAKLREKEDHAELQRATIARLDAELGRVPVLPSTDRMMKFLRALPEAVDKRPDEAREVLRAALVGPVKCFPATTPGEAYRIRFDLDPSFLLETTKPAPGLARAGSARGSCGGRI
ncbi:MAG: recombinase family protein [Polyangiales bacterium]